MPHTGFDQELTEADDVIRAFQGLLLVTAAPPVYPWYENFSSAVNGYLAAPPFNFKSNLNNHSKIVSADRK